MTELESHTLAWMREIDGKLDDIKTEMTGVNDRLGRIKDELLVLNGIVLRLQSREIESTGLKRLHDRHERRLAGIERRLTKLEESRES